MWVGWDLTVFQCFFKASGKFKCTGNVGTGCFGGTSHPLRTVCWGGCGSLFHMSPSRLHGADVTAGCWLASQLLKWESRKVEREGRDAARARSPCWSLWGYAVRAGMIPFCSPWMGCGPSSPMWGHYMRTKQVPDCP